MLSKQDLRRQLTDLSTRATAVAETLAGADDPPPVELATAVVEADKLTQRLEKLAGQLNGNGKGRKKK